MLTAAARRAITKYISTQVQSAVPHVSSPIFLLHVSFLQNHLQAVHKITHTSVHLYSVNSATVWSHVITHMQNTTVTSQKSIP